MSFLWFSTLLLNTFIYSLRTWYNVLNHIHSFLQIFPQLPNHPMSPSFYLSKQTSKNPWSPGFAGWLLLGVGLALERGRNIKHFVTEPTFSYAAQSRTPWLEAGLGFCPRSLCKSSAVQPPIVSGKVSLKSSATCGSYKPPAPST